jgi:hypothetical protein
LCAVQQRHVLCITSIAHDADRFNAVQTAQDWLKT